MTRDEILAAIENLATVDDPDPEYVPSVDAISDRMRNVARLADAYMTAERWDSQYLAEALQSAMRRFADMVRSAR